MAQCYLICADGVEGYEEWWCDVDETNHDGFMTEKEMFGDVRQCLQELGGGHADIIDTETGELFADIEI